MFNANVNDYMNNFFLYDSATGQLELNTPEILLVKEFEALLDAERNKCKQDPKGIYKLRAFREFRYIYLAIHWNSPYADYFAKDRHEEALKDAEMTEEEFEDPLFRAACRKFKELQDSNRSIRLLQAARITVDRCINYFETVDPQERDEINFKPIYKMKDIQSELSNLNKVHEALVILESQVKKELSESTSLRGNVEDGYTPSF